MLVMLFELLVPQVFFFFLMYGAPFTFKKEIKTNLFIQTSRKFIVNVNCLNIYRWQIAFSFTLGNSYNISGGRKITYNIT